MPTIEPFVFRHFAPDTDIPPLLELLTAVQTHDGDGDPVSEATVRDQLSVSGHDPVNDRWVVEEPDSADQLIGFSALWKPPADVSGDAQIVVHPDWRRRGLGGELLDRTALRARERGASHVTLYADTRNEAANDFLKQHGLVAAGVYTEMRAPANLLLDNPIWPLGYTLRSYAVLQDLPTLVEAFNRSYEGRWGHHRVSEEQVEAWLPELTLDGIMLLFGPDDALAGMCRIERSEPRTARNGVPTGYLDAPGIVPEQRDKQLYLPLLLTGMRWLRDAGCEILELESWGDDEDTLARYNAAGFNTLRQETSYRLDVQA